MQTWMLDEVPVAVLAGGLATRLGPITRTMPKSMVDIDGRPFIDHQLALLKRQGIRKVVLCLGHLGEQVEEHLRQNPTAGLDIRFSYDGERLLGTGGALRRAMRYLGDVFWVLYGDSYIDIDYRPVLDRFNSSQALGLMTVLRNDNQWDRSNVVFRDGQLLCYDKKTQSPEMTHIDYGLGLLKREALDRLSDHSAHDLATLYQELVAQRQMIGCEVTERFYEIGSFAGLEETRAFLQRAANEVSAA